MANFIDSVLMYRILQLLTTPIEESDAFKLGIIDKNGRKLRNPTSINERDSYSLLNKLVFRLQRIIKRAPRGEQDLKRLASSSILVKECLAKEINPTNLELQYFNLIETIDDKTVNEIFESFENKMLSFSDFLIEDAPVNNASATPGIDGFTPATLGVKKKIKKFMINKRNNPKII